MKKLLTLVSLMIILALAPLWAQLHVPPPYQPTPDKLEQGQATIIAFSHSDLARPAMTSYSPIHYPTRNAGPYEIREDPYMTSHTSENVVTGVVVGAIVGTLVGFGMRKEKPITTTPRFGPDPLHINSSAAPVMGGLLGALAGGIVGYTFDVPGSYPPYLESANWQETPESQAAQERKASQEWKDSQKSNGSPRWIWP